MHASTERLARALAALALSLACAVSVAQDASAWFDATGRPTPAAQEAVALLADASSHGIAPADYAAPALQDALRQASQDPVGVQRIGQALSRAMERYLADLHQGRLDPRAIGLGFTPAHLDSFDAAALLRQALAEGRLAAAVRAAAPQLPQYERLREALGTYRTLAGDPAWAQRLPALPPAKARAPARLEPGAAWDGLAVLTQRLVALGDLPPGTPAPLLFDGALVAALRGFQRRHGLADDGVLGRATLAALEVPPAARMRQLELTLERLRWTPLRRAPRMIVVNIPEFVLRAYELDGDKIVLRREMKVIVGKALNTRTPLFDEQMRFIEFSPYWNVPPSIARAELVPKLRRDPGHWAQEGFEFVGGDGSVQTELSSAGLEAVLAGRQRIRQRPGPRNALGDIKFVFPNSDNIYLHHTPATGLFARERRDFSHGCIRVEQPVELASFVLADRPEWPEARIREAMAAGQSSTLRLDEPLPVLIAYGTSLVRGGRIHFFDDVYGQDRALDNALQRATRARTRIL